MISSKVKCKIAAGSIAQDTLMSSLLWSIFGHTTSFPEALTPFVEHVKKGRKTYVLDMANILGIFYRYNLNNTSFKDYYTFKDNFCAVMQRFLETQGKKSYVFVIDKPFDIDLVNELNWEKIDRNKVIFRSVAYYKNDSKQTLSGGADDFIFWIVALAVCRLYEIQGLDISRTVKLVTNDTQQIRNRNKRGKLKTLFNEILPSPEYRIVIKNGLGEQTQSEIFVLNVIHQRFLEDNSPHPCKSSYQDGSDCYNDNRRIRDNSSHNIYKNFCIFKGRYKTIDKSINKSFNKKEPNMKYMLGNYINTVYGIHCKPAHNDIQKISVIMRSACDVLKEMSQKYEANLNIDNIFMHYPVEENEYFHNFIVLGNNIMDKAHMQMKDKFKSSKSPFYDTNKSDKFWKDNGDTYADYTHSSNSALYQLLPKTYYYADKESDLKASELDGKWLYKTNSNDTKDYQHMKVLKLNVENKSLFQYENMKTFFKKLIMNLPDELQPALNKNINEGSLKGLELLIHLKVDGSGNEKELVIKYGRELQRPTMTYEDEDFKNPFVIV